MSVSNSIHGILYGVWRHLYRSMAALRQSILYDKGCLDEVTIVGRAECRPAGLARVKKT